MLQNPHGRLAPRRDRNPARPCGALPLKRTRVFFDGGLRPAGMEIAAVVRGRATIVRDLGPGTSMTAEWLALIHALRLARAAGLDHVALMGDAAAVVAQANGTVRVHAAHRDHLATFHALAAQGPPPRVRHVKRAQNLAGIALERLER